MGVTDPAERMSTILDALATSNRIARANVLAVRNLTYALTIVGALLVFIIITGRHPK